MVTQGLPPEDVMTVLRFIGPGRRRAWERRKRVLAIFGRSQLGAEVSSRDLERRREFSRGWACRVLRELHEAKVLIQVWPAAGPRAAAYRVNPAIGEWRDVPWTVDDLRLVVAEVLHEELLGAPNLRPVARSHGLYRDAVRSSGALEAGSPRHNQGQRRGESGLSATQGGASGAVNGGSARHSSGGGQRRGFGSVDGDDSRAAFLGAAAEAGSDLEAVRVKASIEQWVKARLRLKFFRGAERDQLVALAAEVGLDAVHDAIASHEPDLESKPQFRMKDLVSDVAYAVLGGGDLGALAYEPPPPSEPEARRPREWKPGDDAEVLPLEDRQARLAEIRRARAAGAGDLPSEQHQEVQHA